MKFNKIFRQNNKLFPRKFNNNWKKSILFLVAITSLFFALWIWDKIILPVSETSYAGYHSQTDTLKFIFFILISLVPFLFLYLKFFKNRLFSINSFLKIKTGKVQFKGKKFLNYFFYILIIFLIYEFFILDFAWFIGPIDIFHEGVQLTPSNNFRLSEGSWTASFLERGLFGNLFPIIMWFLSENQSIGATRLGTILLTLLNKVLLVLLAKQISENINFKNLEKILFFLSLSLIFISFTDYYDQSHFSRRFVLYLLFFNVLIQAISIKNNLSSSNILLGFISIVSFLWWLDIALYLNTVLLLVLIFNFYRKENLKFYSILIGLTLGIITILLFIPYSELKILISNAYLVTQIIEIIGNLEYPSPLFGDDGRATKILIFFTLTGLFLIITCLDKNNKINNNLKIFFLFFFISSLISFKYGLTRSDGPHIQAGSATMLSILSFLVLYFLFNFISNLNLDKFLLKYKNFIYLLTVFALIYNFNLQKVYLISESFNKMNNLVSAKQSDFLTHNSTDYKKLIKYYKKISANHECVQILTDEIAVPYLLNKKSCTSFNIMELLKPKNMQLKFIDELKLKKPKVILYRSKKFTYGNGESLTLVNKYIESNYTFHSKIDYWTFVKINK